RAGVAIYPVDARGLLARMPAQTADDLFSQITRRSLVADGQGLEPTGISQMRTLAEETGGRAFVNTNDLAGAIREAVDDAAVTYTLGFYPASDTLDGKFHHLKVQVYGRSGLEIRSPSGYFAVKDDVSPLGQSDDLANALRSPLELSAIHIEAHSEPPGQPNSASFDIAGSIRLADLNLKNDGKYWRGDLGLYVVQQDTGGQVLAESKSRYQLQLTGEMYLSYEQSGLPFRCAVHSKPGIATLRILVHNRVNGTVGSLIIPVSAIESPRSTWPVGVLQFERCMKSIAYNADRNGRLPI
ncbi:MAG TPA: VWA domain-containing protein, partial [Bryobacteraceae bacterium]|nr:VWA domain-containing protein [Bryobacteraceae bacterium]